MNDAAESPDDIVCVEVVTPYGDGWTWPSLKRSSAVKMIADTKASRGHERDVFRVKTLRTAEEQRIAAEDAFDRGEDDRREMREERERAWSEGG